jgi:hypothetical protein
MHATPDTLDATMDTLDATMEAVGWSAQRTRQYSAGGEQHRRRSA